MRLRGLEQLWQRCRAIRVSAGCKHAPTAPRCHTAARRAAQEPQNAHSHLLSMVLGNSETIPITQGALALGTWQSVLLVELDGARKRTVGVQVVGVPASGSSS